MVDKQSPWQLERPRPFQHPSLESVIEEVTDEAKSGNSLREKTSEEIAHHIRSIPRIIWETIIYISMTHSHKLIQMKSATEGCLIHCGLAVIEDVFKKIPDTKKTWLEAYMADNTNTLLDFIAQHYATEYMGKGIGHTRKVFFLNTNDNARAMEISTKYGFHLTEVVILAMTAGIAQSVRLLPDHVVENAKNEIVRFERWLKGIKYK